MSELPSGVKKVDLWTKKLGPSHISGPNGSTLCGVPMLGNNYSKYLDTVVLCEKCLTLLKR